MSSVLSTVKSRDFAFKINLEDVYFHEPVHPDSQKYLPRTFQHSRFDQLVRFPTEIKSVDPSAIADALARPVFPNYCNPYPSISDIGNLDSVVCRSSVVFDLPSGPDTARSHLGREVVPSARIEALRQHLQATGFSEDVFRFAAALLRPLRNRMYDDRWLRFAGWTAEQGTDLLGSIATQVTFFLHLFRTHGLAL